MIELLDQNTTEQSNTKANINSLATVLSMEASAMFSITVWECKLVPSFNNGRRYY
jgi:ribosome recycling factor